MKPILKCDSQIPIESERLKSIRTRIGLTQKQLGQALGYTDGPIISYAEGGLRPKLTKKILLACAAKFGVSETGFEVDLSQDIPIVVINKIAMSKRLRELRGSDGLKTFAPKLNVDMSTLSNAERATDKISKKCIERLISVAEKVRSSLVS